MAAPVFAIEDVPDFPLTPTVAVNTVLLVAFAFAA